MAEPPGLDHKALLDLGEQALERAIDHLQACGELLILAHVQAALDALHARKIVLSQNNRD
jgi:hypothetical protein